MGHDTLQPIDETVSDGPRENEQGCHANTDRAETRHHTSTTKRLAIRYWPTSMVVCLRLRTPPSRRTLPAAIGAGQMVCVISPPNVTTCSSSAPKSPVA